tara:strand:+ start:149 stop:1000 length:852 start_codon:yes stop_codon:yes gene_type:complete
MTELVFVQIPRGKKQPNRKGWNLRENCFSGPISELSGENVGLAHAYCTPVHCALDIDYWPSAKNLFEEINLDIEKVLRESSVAIIHSGRKHSLKAIYTLPKTVGALATKAVKQDGRVAYEFRCASTNGLTVCDVIPPSIHPQGTQYKWIQNDLGSLSEIPTPLLAHWMKVIDEDKIARKVVSESYVYGFSGSETPRKIALLREQLSYVNPDCDYQTWRNIVWAILSTEFSSAHDIARDWSEGAPHRYNYSHFYSTVQSWKHSSAKHTWGTIYHYARIGGWRNE